MLNADKAKDQLKETLNTNEYIAYQPESPNFLQRLWEKAQQWIIDLLSDLIPSIEPSTGAANAVLITTMIVVIALLAVFLFVILRNARRKQKFRYQNPLQDLHEMEWSYTRHLSEAKKLESQGEYSPATRHLFLALLLYFHDREWLEARVWKTNWEYYEELVKVNKAWAKKFYHLALIFDEVTYGEKHIGKEEYDSYHNEVLLWVAEEKDANPEQTARRNE